MASPATLAKYQKCDLEGARVAKTSLVHLSENQVKMIIARHASQISKIRVGKAQACLPKMLYFLRERLIKMASARHAANTMDSPELVFLYVLNSLIRNDLRQALWANKAQARQD